MKRTVKICLATAVAIMAAGCALLTNFHYNEMKGYEKDPALADYNARVAIPGLSGKVDVYRDKWAIPHVFADDPHDLFFAAGYVQAQDRLWQMIMFRAIAEGRTAELLGDIGVPGVQMAGMPLSTTALDRHQRVMGMNYLGKLGEAMLQETNPEVYSRLQAFCDGVNAYIDSHGDYAELPVEFRILKVKPDHWRVRDIISFSKFIGSLLCSNMAVELPRYAAIKKYGPEKGWRLFPIHGAPGPSIVPTSMLQNRLDTPRDIPPGGRPSPDEVGYDLSLSADAASALLAAEHLYRRALNIDPAMGSNNWVVSGKLTESGAAMLANDPHLQHVEPSLFYIMRLKGAGYDAYGVTFAGNPYVVLGHTRKLGWGSTTSRADVQDLFIETTDPERPGKYLYKGEWRPFTVRKETCKVRVGKSFIKKELSIRHTVHGPVINDIVPGLPKGTPPVALRWSAWDMSRDTRAFDLAVSTSSVSEFMKEYRAMDDKFGFLNITLALEKLNRGDCLDDFIHAMELVDLPNQNWVATDSEGRIAYLPGGLVPVRGKGIGVLPVPGESGEFDWTGHIPLMELPHAIDPERGYMISANNQVVDPRYYPYVFSTHYAEPWRAMRIEEMIKELAPLDMEDMKRIQNDVQVRRARRQVPMILDAVEEKDPADKRLLAAAEELRQWDYEARLSSTAPVIFFEYLKALFDNTMADEVDKGDLSALKQEGYSYMVVDLCLSDPECDFFDDKDTPEIEDRADIMVASLADAVRGVDRKWGRSSSDRRWGDIHVIKWYHMLGLLQGDRMSVGPFPHLGADHTVRNAKVAGFGKVPYKTMVGPCQRHIMDMSSPDKALMVIDGSQSGQWLSPHYDDMHKLFLKSGYVIADKNPARVKKAADYHMVMRPE